MRTITRKKLVSSKKEDILISVKQIKEMFSEIDNDTNGFIVWLGDRK